MSVRFALAVALVAGCAAAEKPERKVDVELTPASPQSATALEPPRQVLAEPPLPSSAIFVPDPEKAFPRRAIIARYGKARFSPGAEPVIDPKAPIDDDEVEMVVLESGPELIRVLYSWSDIRLALYLEAGDLREVPVREVALDIALSDAPVDARLVLFPGAEVDFSGKRAGERRVRVHPERTGIDASGWIKDTDVGRVFVPVEDDAPATPLSIRTATQLHTSATGPAFGSIAPEQPLGVRALGDAKNGRRKIAIAGKRFLVEGWVAESAVHEAGVLTGGSGGKGYGWGGSNAVWLPAGAALFSAADGPQIGIVRRQTVMDDRADRRDGRRRVGAHVPPWGWVDVWAEDASFAEAIRQEKEKRQRRARYKILRATVTSGFKDPRPQLQAKDEDTLGCVEALEKNGSDIAGELRIVMLADKAGWPEKTTFSGPLSKNDALVACVTKALNFGLGPNARSRPGTLDATIEIGKKPK